MYVNFWLLLLCSFGLHFAGVLYLDGCVILGYHRV